MTITRDFCFCTVASLNYISDAAGFWASIREVHEDLPLLILTLDKQTHDFFSGKQDLGIHVLSAQQAWGVDHWKNLLMRTNIPEGAYASKSALIHWILQNQFARSTLLLDCDIVLLAPIPDLIEQCMHRDLVLVPTRHELKFWRRTQRTGLFSAGVVGFSKNALPVASAWKAMCFDQCTVLPIDGVYNEQKYLEYFIGHVDTAIIRDPGINVSATILDTVQPKKNNSGGWETGDGKPIRMFHVSRTTDPSHPLSKLKSEYDKSALEQLAGDEFFRDNQSFVSLRQRDGKSTSVSLGSLFERTQTHISRFFRGVMLLQRILQSREAGFLDRIRGAFSKRGFMSTQLWERRENEE